MMTLPTDVKELIPEFYSDPSFLTNSEKLDFGERTSGNTLPPLLPNIQSCTLPSMLL